MAGLGWQELVIVLVIIMIIFGAGKLTEIAKSLGQGVKEFRDEASAQLCRPPRQLRRAWMISRRPPVPPPLMRRSMSKTQPRTFAAMLSAPRQLLATPSS